MWSEMDDDDDDKEEDFCALTIGREGGHTLYISMTDLCIGIH